MVHIKKFFLKGEKRGSSYLEMGEDIKVRRSLLIFLRGEEGVSREDLQCPKLKDN